MTITDIRMSKDLKHAKVYVTSRLSGDQLEQGVAALNRAASYIRKQLAARIYMKYTPAIRFFKDSSIERAGRVSALIDSVSNSNPA